MKRKLLSGVMFIGLISGLALAVSAQTILGGYKPVAKDDARVVKAAEFAIGNRAETNSEEEDMTLESVEKAEVQVVGGTNYKICMAVNLDEETQYVQAVVYQNLKQVYSLTSWNMVESCGESDEGDGANSFKNDCYVYGFISNDIKRNFFAGEKLFYE